MSKIKLMGNVFGGVCLTAALSVASAAEPAATLSRIDGVAVVSQGAEYNKGHEGMKLSEGDRLLVLDGGKAVISFADGCQYTLADTEVLTLGASSTCASNAAGVYKIDPYSTVATDATVAGQSFNLAALEPPVPPAVPPVMGAAGTPTWGWLLAGAVIIGGAVAIANDDDDDDRRIVPVPPSP